MLRHRCAGLKILFACPFSRNQVLCYVQISGPPHPLSEVTVFRTAPYLRDKAATGQLHGVCPRGYIFAAWRSDKGRRVFARRDLRGCPVDLRRLHHTNLSRVQGTPAAFRCCVGILSIYMCRIRVPTTRFGKLFRTTDSYPPTNLRGQLHRSTEETLWGTRS